MDITIAVTDAAKLAALSKARAAFNTANAAQLDESEFMQRLIDGQLDGLVAAYLVTNVTKLAFLNRFTSGERIAIRTAAQSTPAIADYLAMLDAAQDVSLIDSRTVAGAQALEAVGLLDPGRGAQILAL